MVINIYSTFMSFLSIIIGCRGGVEAMDMLLVNGLAHLTVLIKVSMYVCSSLYFIKHKKRYRWRRLKKEESLFTKFIAIYPIFSLFFSVNDSFKLLAYNSCYIACWQILILVTQSSVVVQYCLAGWLLSTCCTKRNSRNTQTTSNDSSTPFTPVPVTAQQSTWTLHFIHNLWEHVQRAM